MALVNPMRPCRVGSMHRAALVLFLLPLLEGNLLGAPPPPDFDRTIAPLLAHSLSSLAAGMAAFSLASAALWLVYLHRTGGARKGSA